MIDREGNDGPWSTFSLRVGTPVQNVRVLVGTSNPDTLVVYTLGCPEGKRSSTDDCPISRGALFDFNSSTTWKDQGVYGLGLETNFNNTDRGEFGIDTVGLGLSNSPGDPTLEGQVVAGIVTEDFWLGNLGLNVQPTNFTTFDHPLPSFFQTLMNQNLIPSLTWSYTAGAQYRQ